MGYPFLRGLMQYFDNYPNNENIGLSLSGGADSALLLYLFAKMINDRKESTQMFSRNNFHVKKDRRYCPLLPSTQTTTTTTFV
jgi:NH3-dependent NAD+ synthetase